MKLGPTDKLVLLALADIANDEGEAYPSNKLLTERTGLCERAVRLSLTRLSAAGVLAQKFRTGRSTIYLLNPGTSCPPARNAPQEKTPDRGALDAHGGAPDAGEGAPRAPITITKPSPTRQKKKKGDAFALPDWISADWWRQWEEHRRAIRKPLTDLARLLQVERLQELAADGHEPVDCIKAAIANRWQGFYPPPARAAAARASPADRRDAETAEFLGRLTGGLAGTKPQHKDAVDVEPAHIRRIA